MIRKFTLFAASLAVVGTSALASASTVAYWRFENSVRLSDSSVVPAVNGASLDAATVGTFPAGPFSPNPNEAVIPDVSGNNNYLHTFNAGTSGTFTSGTPYATVPQSNAANNYAWNISTLASNGAPRDLYETNTGNLRSAMNGAQKFTIEATFKLASEAGFQTIVGRDRVAGDSGAGPLASLWFGVCTGDGPAGSATEDNRLHFYTWNPTGGLTITDQGQTGNSYVGVGPALSLNTWYSAAAVGDGVVVKLFLKGPSDASYVQVGQLLQAGLGTMNGGWTVGRGQFNGVNGDPFKGMIDEVRISDTNLAPAQLLAVPEPASLAALGTVGVLLRRRR